MHYFITEISDDIHKVTYSYVASTKNKDEDDELINALCCSDVEYMTFETLEEAHNYMDNYLFIRAIDYTKFILNDLDVSKIPYDSRYIIVYVGKLLSPNEGFYKLPLTEFILLKSYDIRFPTLTELDVLVKVNDTVSVHSDIWTLISPLFTIQSTSFFEENSHDLSLTGDDIHKKLARLFKLVATQHTDLKPYFRKVFGNLEDAVIDKMINLYITVVNDIKKMIDAKVDQQTACEYFYKRCEEFPMLAKESKTIVGYIY